MLPGNITKLGIMPNMISHNMFIFISYGIGYAKAFSLKEIIFSSACRPRVESPVIYPFWSETKCPKAA